tara:strand:- start:1700 stop:2140 length:441 start_codon:yes stop_codon:yes gene_type:complete
MEEDKARPFVLYVAETIYKKVFGIKNSNPDLNNIEAFEIFIASKDYDEISSGQFHDDWFKQLENNNYVDMTTKKKINEETFRLLQIQKDTMIKQLMKIPKLYYAKSHFPLELSQRAFDHLWRVCESYELWCKETKQNNLILLNLTD